MDYSKYTSTKTLLAAALPVRSFFFDQGKDWVNVRWHGGVCDAATLDWVRRKAFNKRSLGSKKYETGWIWNGEDRRKLGAKHVLLSQIFREEVTAAVKKAPKLGGLMFGQSGAAKAQTEAYQGFVARFHGNAARKERKAKKGIVQLESGFEKMTMVSPGSADGMATRDAREGVVGALLDTKEHPAEVNGQAWWGLMIALLPSEDGSGHAVGLFQRDGSYCFFDPNHGEYDFGKDAASLVSFVSSLWCVAYDEYATIIPRYLAPI
ncbi:YopT-type cysteine protease domain-containing protein [Vitiosangium sp. GDMCC 1.1324]|uniref:YopT-type cysteine protease domain-containing protein n=1 Tax=Vitiosangium sp. (strain GDMCC 1.1324) TaxID=2138576 RepID=UPI00130DEA30|nr:YopT-type cysteine protease domain-containing protein [Vitiosangium sp. GDMCC 1.1324]